MGENNFYKMATAAEILKVRYCKGLVAVDRSLATSSAAVSSVQTTCNCMVYKLFMLQWKECKKSTYWNESGGALSAHASLQMGPHRAQYTKEVLHPMSSLWRSQHHKWHKIPSNSIANMFYCSFCISKHLLLTGREVLFPWTLLDLESERKEHLLSLVK